MKGSQTALIANKAAIFLAFVGIFIGLTLTVAHFQNLVPPCSGEGLGCSAVLTSRFAYLGPIPVALVGLIGYLTLAGLAVYRSSLSGDAFKRFGMAGFGLSAFGFLTSCVYTVISLAVIGLPCQWCLGSAAVMTLLFLTHAVLISQPAPEEKASFDVVSTLAGAAVATVLFIPSISSLRASAFSGMSDVDVSSATREMLLPANEAKIQGNKDGKVILVEFADPNCGACRSAAPKVDELKTRYGSKMAFVFSCFPLYDKPGHETSIDACAALEYAAEKGKYKELYREIWDPANTEQVKSDSGLLMLVKRAGLDADEFQKLKNATEGPDHEKYKKYVEEVAGQLDFANKTFRISATPTFVLWAEGAEPKAVGGAELQGALESEPYRSLLQ